MHISYGHKHDLKMEVSPPVTQEAIVSRTTTTEILTTTTTIESSLPTDDENTPLVVKPAKPVDSGKTPPQKKSSFPLKIIILFCFNSCTEIN